MAVCPFSRLAQSVHNIDTQSAKDFDCVALCKKIIFSSDS